MFATIYSASFASVQAYSCLIKSSKLEEIPLLLPKLLLYMFSSMGSLFLTFAF